VAPRNKIITASSISRRLIIYIVLCSSAITLVLTVFQLHRDYRADQDLIDQGFEQIEKVHLETIKESLWSVDTATLKTIIAGLSNLRDVKYAAIIENGEVLVSVGDKRIAEPDLRSFPLVHDSGGGALEIGQLNVVVDLSAAYRRLLDKAFIILVSNAIKIALVAVFMILIFQHVLINHLTRISNYIRSINMEGSFVPLVLSRKRHSGQQKDELDLVVTSINEAFKRFIRGVANVQQAEDRYRNLFESAEISIWNEDFSEVCKALDQLREDGVTDLRQYLGENELAVWDMAAMVKVNQVNDATLRLFKAKSEHDFIDSIDKVFGSDAVRVFIDELCAIWEKKKLFQSEINQKTLDGEDLTVIISMPIPETDDGFRNIPVSILDITERKLTEQALSYQATHDALTGLINRSDFERRLARVLETARSSQDEHALCYLDLDQFKVINDTCGHMAGDELLRQLGQMLPTAVRKRDTLARLGGDEFGVLMEHCTLEQAHRVANEIRETIADFRFPWQQQVFRIGVSIGLVPITETSESVANVLSAADSACYAAKDEGRNRVHIFHLGDTELARRQGEMQWVGRINQALEDNRFALWSQKIVPAQSDSGGADHFELLLRLIDERGETVLPGAFLPAAERYGLATKLDRWVIAAALAWLGGHPQRLKQLHLCCINLSGASLADPEFLEFVQAQLQESGVPAEKICFEVTETATIANLSRAIDFMGKLKARGCKFALDDFGSGLSSFAYLKTLPVDYLKIDGAFVKDIVDDEVDLAMVRSINDVGKAMGKRTIAEFVENDAILQKLREIGVDYAQGYGIGPPTPILETALSDSMAS
jgi:diguanylate cyclase (GGDEF)-like protein